jgi:MFS transporter, Spinster family, sphingosine-1-phosphate transporter
MALASHHAVIDPADYRPVSSRTAWSVFGLLFALMVVDYVDRQVVVSMFPHLKSYWNLTDSQLGGIVSVVSIPVALGAVPLSLLADRWSRVKSIFLMAIVWSLATIACAFTESYAQLLGTRAIVGLGEAAYGTVGAALIASLFPARMRSSVLGAFLFAGILGSVLGVMLGGVIAERWGWQAGFGTVGVPGLFLAVAFLFLVRDYKTVALPGPARKDGAAKVSARAVIAELRRPRTALVTCIGAGFNLLVVSTTYAWLPSYFNRFYGIAPDKAGLKTALVVIVGGLGALLWSIVADRLSSRMPRARLIIPAVTAVLTTVFMCAAFIGFPPGNAQFALIVLGGLMMAGSVGPTDAVVIDVIHPGLRATGASILSLTRNLFGLAGGPLLAGALSDSYGLPFALSVVPLFCLAAAALYFYASRYYLADLKSARTAAQPESPFAAMGAAPELAPGSAR